jgi:STE24 endopeptidase
VGSYFLDNIILILNSRKQPKKIPALLDNLMKEDDYQQNLSYNKERSVFSFFQSTFSLALLLSFIFLDGFAFVDHWARSFNFSIELTGLLFFGAIGFGSSILNIPFSLYSTFRVEQKYGHNRSTLKTFITDRLKGFMLAAIIGAPLLAIVIWFFYTFQDNGWLYAWGLVVTFSILMSFVAPVLLFPLFNKFDPLSDEELNEKIQKYAKDQKFSLKGIFQMDGSKRSNKLNAFFTGFGKYRRIVLFDTLLDKLDHDEIIAVIAHEMGHYKKKHLYSGLVISTLSSFVMFYVLSIFITDKALFSVFGIEEVSVYAGIMFFSFLYSPVEMVLSVLGNFLSRKHEYEADAYAASSTGLAKKLISSLKKLSFNNMSLLLPSSLDVFFHYTHPPLSQRIAALEEQA